MIPLLVTAHEFGAHGHMIPKTSYQQLCLSLVGPPESVWKLVAASKAMRNGNWSTCRDFIINEMMNAKVTLLLWYFFFLFILQ
jgi:translation initiation factor 3 subunit C